MNFEDFKKATIRFFIAFTIVSFLSPTALSADRNESALQPILMLLLNDDSNIIEPLDAARFLTQATYGPTLNEITALTNSSYERWIDNQFALPATNHIEFGQDLGFFRADGIPVPSRSTRVSTWVHVAMDAPDQLRQRMAFALSQIFVISDLAEGRHSTVTQYYDLLTENAFGNYRDLLEKVTLNQDMGFFLGMAGNQRANAELNIMRPDENFAREIMQLFSIGLIELNLDGTPKLNEQGLPIPTYTQTHVEELAQALTGWHMAFISNATFQQNRETQSGFNLPMISFPMYHDTTSKNLIEVPGFSPTLPPNQTPEQDLEQALDRIANHPNVAPFISKQLIQRFVTSNPSPAYVRRIATVFNNTDGSLQAVLRAILLDDEARNGHISQPNTFGKIKEPILKLTGFWRGIGLLSRTPFIGSNLTPIEALDQIPLSAPSVFNFFPPDHSPAGRLNNNGLLAPEGLLLDEASVIEMGAAFTDFSLLTSQDEDFRIPIATDHLEALVPDNLMRPADLIEHLNIVLLASSMTDEMREVLLNMHSREDSAYRPSSKLQVVNDILNIIALSPHFNVQR